MLSKTLLLALLPALALAKIHPPKGSVYVGLLAIDSGTDLQYAQINATGGTFKIGAPTNTFCASGPGNQCSSFPNETYIALDTESGQAAMLAEVPGGQDVYVRKDGALSFTEPHEEGIYPHGYELGRFTYKRFPKHGTAFLGYKNGTANAFYACQELPGEYNYGIFVNVPGFVLSKTCQEIGILAYNVTELGAFQYD